jgi:putative transposase
VAGERVPVASEPEGRLYLPKIVFPLVHEMAATGTHFPVLVAAAFRVLGFSKQAYYQWLAEPVSDREWADAHLINAARDAWKEDPCLGYRLIADGWVASERRVWRLYSQ